MPGPIPSVPLQTPFFDGSGDADGKELVRKLGRIDRTWAVFFTAGPGWITQGTHAERLALSPEGVPDGAFFLETDRGSLYQSRFVVRAQAWVFAVGSMSGLLAARPADLAPTDAGFLYTSTDVLDYRWDGTAWAALGTVRGGASLTHVNRVTKVTAAGTIGEAAFADTDVVLGAAALIHDGRLLMVSAVDGVASESAVTDDETTVYATGRDLGAGATAPDPASITAGRRYLFAKGSAGAGAVDLSQIATDADAVSVALYQATDTNSTAADKRLAAVLISTLGATANNRGGALRFFTKRDNLSGLIERGRFDNAGNMGLGGNAAPAEAMDATGNANVSGVYKVAGTQVVGSRQTGWTVPTATLARGALTNASTTTEVLRTLAALVTDLMNSGIIGT